MNMPLKACSKERCKWDSDLLLFWTLAIFFFLAKQWLVNIQSLSVPGEAIHDEHLFARSAWWILSGNWLGPYDSLTLIKGPFYPLWIAAANILRLPLLFSQHLLYAVACLALILAVRPLALGWKSLTLLFVVLLFNPMSFSGEIMPRVMREGIYPALSMISFAGAVGIYLRAGSSEHKVRLWVILLAIALPAFWLTREEGVWLLPGLFILHLGACGKWFAYFRLRHDKFVWKWLKTCGFSLGTPYFALILILWLVAGLNHHYYGVFTVVEVKSEPFVSAYGALSRVEQAEPERYAAVPYEVRRQIYRVSPSFAEIEEHLDGAVGKKWIEVVCAPTRSLRDIDFDSDFYRYIDLINRACDDVSGGWFVWAFRESVAATGYHESALSAKRFYDRLAGEVNGLCEQNQLKCLSPRSTLRPPLYDIHLKAMLNSMLEATANLIFFKSFSPNLLPSTGSQEQIAFFSGIAGDNILHLDTDLSEVYQSYRMTILRFIGHLYQSVTGLVLVLALLFGFYFYLFVDKNVILKPFLIVFISVVSVIFARISLLSLVDVYSFPALSPQYLSPLYPFVIFLLAIMIRHIFNCTTKFMHKDIKYLEDK